MQPELRAYVFARDNWHCLHCNNSSTLDPHHIVYRSQGGKDEAKNLLTLCRKCHDDVHCGRLKIEIVRFDQQHPVVKFWKWKGWKP